MEGNKNREESEVMITARSLGIRPARVLARVLAATETGGPVREQQRYVSRNKQRRHSCPQGRSGAPPTFHAHAARHLHSDTSVNHVLGSEEHQEHVRIAQQLALLFYS